MLQRSCDEAVEARFNRSQASLSSQMKARIKGTLKDHVRTRAKRAAKDYAKAELKAWINAQEGPCLDAVDIRLGASQEIYGCFKENYAQLEEAFCTPPEQHDQVLSALTTIRDIAKVINLIANPMRRLPYVGGAASTIYSVSQQVQRILTNPIRNLESMMQQRYGKHLADQRCCPPLSPHHCRTHPGALYRCASCNDGAMCFSKRACNWLRTASG